MLPVHSKTLNLSAPHQPSAAGAVEHQTDRDKPAVGQRAAEGGPIFAALPTMQPQVIDWKIGDGPLAGLPPIAAAIGNFDGVHIGHQALIRRAVAAAEQAGLTPAVICFRPHPRRYFAPDGPAFALLDEETRISRLAAAGARLVIRLGFDAAMQGTQAADFINQVLPALNLRVLVAGADFGFGKSRGGGMALLAELGASLPPEARIEAVPVALEEMAGSAVSSSRIRQAIAEGALSDAARLLGSAFSISGEVTEGDQRGRQIGFPTANIPLQTVARAGCMQPPWGVYAVAVRQLGHSAAAANAAATASQAYIHAGVANIGIRPSVVDRGVLLEVHLLDAEVDLYGKQLEVGLLKHIRPEQRFDGLEALQAQIALDAGQARQFHATRTGLPLAQSRQGNTANRGRRGWWHYDD